MLFLKVNKISVDIQCNTSLSKNYIAHSITVVRVIGWIWEKQTCLRSLCIWNQS